MQGVIDRIDKAGAQVLRAGAIIRNFRAFTGRHEANRSAESMNAVVGDAIELGFAGAARLDARLMPDLDVVPPRVETGTAIRFCVPLAGRAVVAA